jgi:hypothetical protein
VKANSFSYSSFSRKSLIIRDVFKNLFVTSTALDLSNWEPTCEDLIEISRLFAMYLYHIYSYLPILRLPSSIFVKFKPVMLEL